MKATHRRLLLDMCQTLKLDVPANILFMLDESSGSGNANGSANDRSAKPDAPTEKPKTLD